VLYRTFGLCDNKICTAILNSPAQNHAIEVRGVHRNLN
jgi:hypothetical protein